MEHTSAQHLPRPQLLLWPCWLWQPWGGAALVVLRQHML